MRYKLPKADTSSLALSTAFGMMVLSGCLFSSEASAQSICAPILGIDILCQGGPPADPTLQILNLPPIVGPVSVTLDDGFQLLSGAQLTTQGAGADVALNALGTATIDTVNQVGLLVNSDGRIDGGLTHIITDGDGAAGAVLNALDDVIFTVDDVVSTVGDNAPGLDIDGATISLTTDQISTSGNNSNGVQLLSLEGPINFDANAIDTAGDLSTAALLRSAGNINLNLGVLRTEGSQALGLDIATDPATCILLGTGGCDVTAAADQITTNGFGGIGAFVSAVTGVTTIQADLLQTGGDEAAGLDLSTDPTVCAALGTGACDQNFTVGNLLTGGDRSPGALVRAAGNITANIDVLRTEGEDAIGLDLASDPDACVLLGAGNCGTSFNIGELTTSGAGATGVLARIVGPTTGRIGLLGTTGDNATGIDITGDPDACVLLGNGACDVDLTSGQVTTTGDGALGVLIDVPANVLADIAGITTSGNNATGLRVITDPTLCLVIGGGACSVDVSTGPVDTGGDGSGGVDVDGGDGPTTVTTGPVHTGGDESPGVDVDGGTGPTTVTTGDVDTDGNGSPGVDVSGDGDTSVHTGDVDTDGDDSPGVDVDGGGTTTVDTGNVSTDGGNSTGVDVDGGGPTTVNTGDVTTGGEGSTGVDVDGGNGGDGSTTVDTGTVETGGGTSPGVVVDGGDGLTTVGTGPVTTGGDDSPGVDVSGEGPITVVTGPVTTGGDNSPGVGVDGGTGPVAVDTTPGTISTGGTGSNGVDVSTDSGDQTIITGPVIVTGPGSDGIAATSPGCSQIDITATGPVSSAQGRGIVASSACGVTVTTRQGAPVTGQLAGLDITSGTGSLITIGDHVSSMAGPAINANGGATRVDITENGHVDGYIDLTDADDTVTNDGRFTATADSAFGGGNDLFDNHGVLAVRPDATTARNVTFTDLETFRNSGLIDLRNGVVGETLTLPGTFVGLDGSTLGLDLGTTTADHLIVGGAATGHTDIVVNGTTDAGLLADDVVVVEAGPGTAVDAFSVASTGNTIGLVGYGLHYDPATADFVLSSAPATQAYELVKVSAGARETFYRSSDAWSAHMQTVRDSVQSGETDADRDHALWVQVFATKNTLESQREVGSGDQTRTVHLDNRQNITGAQMGYDFASRNGLLFGLTGGFANSVTDFDRDLDQFKYDTANIGVYGSYTTGRLYANALIRYDRQRVRVSLPVSGIDERLDGSGVGGKAEVGLHFGDQSFFVEPNVSYDYVRTDIDKLIAGPSTVDFDTATGQRGQAGVRIGKELLSGVTRTKIYASLGAVHEFSGEDGVSFTNNGRTVPLPDDRPDDYGRVVIGASIADNSRIEGFVEVSRDFGGNYDGGGLRGGFNVRF